jgi:hypothetical protein
MSRLRDEWDSKVRPLLEEVEGILNTLRKENDFLGSANLVFKHKDKFNDLWIESWDVKEKVKEFYDKNIGYIENHVTPNIDYEENLVSEIKNLGQELQYIREKLLGDPYSTNLYISNLSRVVANAYSHYSKAIAIDKAVKEANLEREVRKYALVYGDEIIMYSEQSRWWLITAICYFITFIFVLIFSTVANFNPEHFIINKFVSFNLFYFSYINNDVERYAVRTLFTLLGVYALIFIIKNYRVTKNLEYILRQKKVSLESYDQFVGSITDNVLKNKVAEAVANQIYEVHDTGLLNTKKVSDSNDQINFPFANSSDLIKNIIPKYENKITLPDELVKKLNLKPGNFLYIIKNKNGNFVLKGNYGIENWFRDHPIKISKHMPSSKFKIAVQEGVRRFTLKKIRSKIS